MPPRLRACTPARLPDFAGTLLLPPDLAAREHTRLHASISLHAYTLTRLHASMSPCIRVGIHFAHPAQRLKPIKEMFL
jgi:hypothetical protein